MAKSATKHRELIGKKFGRLTIKNIIHEKNVYFCDCLCDCGTRKRIRKSDILIGSTKSCGCLQRERAKFLNKKYNKWRFVDGVAIGTTSNNIEFRIDLADYEKCKDICWFDNYDNHTKSYYIYGSQNK